MQPMHMSSLMSSAQPIVSQNWQTQTYDIIFVEIEKLLERKCDIKQ